MKILIVDDDLEILNLLKDIFEDEGFLVYTANDSNNAITLLKNLPDIILLDVRMPVLNGVLATKEIGKVSSAKVIILTTFDEDEYIQNAISFGAKGYLLKNTKPNKIIEAIKMVHAGNSVIQEEVLNKISKNILSDNNTKDLSIFTERELEIIKEICKGSSNKEISNNLFISEGTVKNYITSILQKTNLNHRTQIAINYLNSF